MIILPVQRVQMALGVRKSWLARVGERFPATWDDAARVAHKFQSGDPTGTGAKVFGFALEAAQPRDLIHMLDLFTIGTGLPHTLIDPSGGITIDRPRHAAVLERFLGMFTTDRMVPPDTINYSFNEMYQVIEGGRARMFRVGDWNAAKWDHQALSGDYLLGPWPQFFPGQLKAGVMIGGMRGVAVPQNAPHKALAIAFAQFLLSRPAQQASLDHVGSAVRTDLDVAGLSPHQQQFARPTWNLVAYDFPESFDPTYPKLEANFHRDLLRAIAQPPADMAGFVKQEAVKMQAKAKTLPPDEANGVNIAATPAAWHGRAASAPPHPAHLRVRRLRAAVCGTHDPVWAVADRARHRGVVYPLRHRAAAVAGFRGPGQLRCDPRRPGVPRLAAADAALHGTCGRGESRRCLALRAAARQPAGRTARDPVQARRVPPRCDTRRRRLRRLALALRPEFRRHQRGPGAVGLPRFGGLASTATVLPAVLIAELWHHAGFYVIVFLANLAICDPALDEAAALDGAGRLRRLWHVVLPQLRPAIAINLVYAVIQFLKTFTVVVVMTKGGPADTDQLRQLLRLPAIQRGRLRPGDRDGDSAVRDRAADLALCLRAGPAGPRMRPSAAERAAAIMAGAVVSRAVPLSLLVDAARCAALDARDPC